MVFQAATKNAIDVLVKKLMQRTQQWGAWMVHAGEYTQGRPDVWGATRYARGTAALGGRGG